MLVIKVVSGEPLGVLSQGGCKNIIATISPLKEYPSFQIVKFFFHIYFKPSMTIKRQFLYFEFVLKTPMNLKYIYSRKL